MFCSDLEKRLELYASNSDKKSLYCLLPIWEKASSQQINVNTFTPNLI